MNRYSKTKTKDRVSKEQSQVADKVKTLPFLEDCPRDPRDWYIQANEGTRLDLISNEYYQTPKYWWVIALANKMGKGTLAVTPGYQLRIPYDPQRFIDKTRVTLYVTPGSSQAGKYLNIY